MTGTRLSQTTIQEVVKALPVLIGKQTCHDGELGQMLSGGALRLLLANYYRVMQIAYFVRRGGVKAMIYRLEAGKTKLSPADYLDSAYNRLLGQYKDVYSPERMKNDSLLEQLKRVEPQEEELVKAVLPDLDALILEGIHRQAARPE